MWHKKIYIPLKSRKNFLRSERFVLIPSFFLLYFINIKVIIRDKINYM